jgi:hypothetical protein
MEEEENQEIITATPPDAVVERRKKAAAYQRARVARLRALGLSARGKPLKDRHKNRDPEKQMKYQANYNKKWKAARERLGLTIAEFQKLPRATRLMELNHPRRGKAVKATPAPQRADNGVLPIRSDTRFDTDRSVKFCPHCGWNIDATRKAQAFVDGRVA